MIKQTSTVTRLTKTIQDRQLDNAIRDISEIIKNVGSGDGIYSGLAVFNDAVQTTSGTYERVGAFVFPGTDIVASLSKINAIVRRNGAATSASIRIYDVTNVNVIAEATGITTTDETVFTDMGAISNLPSGEAMFEIQMLRVGAGGGARAFCSGIEIRG